MASTVGGFLVGFGLALLISGLFFGYLLYEYEQDIREAAAAAETMYSFTHSGLYEATMNGLITLGRYANTSINIGFTTITGSQIPLIGPLLSTALEGGNYMANLRSKSEDLYYNLQFVSRYGSQIAFIVAFGGMILIIAGILLIIRARRRA